MQANVTQFSFSVELQPGEKLSLPQAVVDTIGPGRWHVSICTLEDNGKDEPIRDHSAFLDSYGPEDEGLYDDFAAR